MSKKLNAKELTAFYERFQYIESAIWQNHNALNECMAVLGLIKEHVKEQKGDFQTIAGIDALFTLLIHAQGELMQSARIEY
jgi:hypothetical protein